MKKYDSVLGVIADMRPDRYLEVGILNGETLFNVEARVRVGVDVFPFPVGWHSEQGRWQFWAGLGYRLELDWLKGQNTMVFNMTSDEYFNRILSNNTSLRFDVVFIDGAHDYGQAMKDIDNGLKVLRPGGYLIAHDVNPLTELAGTPSFEDFRKKISATDLVDGVDASWNGDVWKCLVELGERGYEYYSVDLVHGLAVVPQQSLKPKLTKQRETEITSLSFEHFDKNREKILRLK